MQQFQRFKVTLPADASGKITFVIDRTKDVRVISSYATLPAVTSNIVRDVSIERSDGTVLGEEKNNYLTSAVSSIVFPDSFIVPHFDPVLVVDTRTVVPSGSLITIDLIYEEVKLS